MAEHKFSSIGQMMRRARAFTLVELLVVIGIIALLISILLPALTRARMQASTLACQANLHSIAQGLLMYAGDNHGTLPHGWWNGGRSPNDPDHQSDWVILTMATLNGKNEVTANGVGGNNSFSRLSRVRPMFLCPDAPGQGLNASDHSSISHYGSHPRIMPSLGPGLAPYKLSHIKRSSEVGLIFEASLYNRNGVNNASGVGAGPPDPTDVWTQANTIPVLTQMNNGGVTGTPSGTSKLLDTPNNPPKYQSNDPVVLIPGTVFVPKLVTNVDNVPKYYSNIRFRHMKNTVTNVLMADGHVQSFHLNTQTFLSDLLQKNVNVNP